MNLTTLRDTLQPPVTLGRLSNTILQSVVKAYTTHWTTNSFAVHKATQDYYEQIQPKLDELVESYQGCYGIQSFTDEPKDCPADFVACLQMCKELSMSFYKACKDEYLSNICQEITAIISQTLYKIQNLK